MAQDPSQPIKRASVIDQIANEIPSGISAL